MSEREDTTLYIERSKVREIVIGHNAATQAVLSKIDALPIFTVGDFRIPAQGMPSSKTDGVREALTRRILDAWRIRFPNNAYAWPGAPEEFASAAAKVCAAALSSTDGGGK